MPALKLRSLFVIYLSLISLTLALVFVYLLNQRYTSQAVESLEEYGVTLAQNTAFLSADYLIAEDFAPLQQFVEEFVRRPKVDMVCIAQRDEVIVASSANNMLGQPMASSHHGERLKGGVVSQAKVVERGDKRQLIILSQVTLEGMHLGTIRLALSMVELDKKLAIATRQGVFIGLAGWLLTMATGLLVARWLRKPMEGLIKRTALIEDGDFSAQRQEQYGVWELNEFSHALNVMAEAIGQREASLQSMVDSLDNLPSPVFSIDPHFTITYINPAGAAVIGHSPEQCVGQVCADLFRTPICGTKECPMRKAMVNDQVVNGETILHHDGEELPVKYTSVVFRDQQNKMVGGLESFIDVSALHQALSASEEQNKLRSAQMTIHERLRGEQDEEELCQILLSELAHFIPFQLGIIYLAEEGPALRLAASYAGEQGMAAPASFQFGQGLVGQAAADGETLLIDQVPEDYLQISSGSGQGVPAAVLVEPLFFEGKVCGVLELGSFVAFNDFSRKLLQRVLENAAIAINMAQSRRRVSQLLQETKRQALELQSQQEELKARNEELRQQTDVLQTSEHQLQQQAEELQSQREELQVANEELAERSSILEKQQEHISQTNKELAQQRNQLLDKTKALETSNRYKSEFLANMSHELRTPLNSILILSQLFAANKEGNLSGKQVEYAQTINNSGSELLTLINEVLDLAKVEAGRIQLEMAPLYLTEFLAEMEQSFAPVAEERSLQLVMEMGADMPPAINTDAQKLRQIVKNLLSNALKFTEQGKVSLTIKRPDKGQYELEEIEGWVVVQVEDSGIGIAADKQDMVFEAFQQVDGSISRRYGGTGLGLSIAREFTSLLGGRLLLDSEEGKGSLFTILLPHGLASEGQQRPELPEPETKKADVPPPVAVGHQDGAEPEPTAADDEDGEEGDDRHLIEPGDKVLLIIEDDPAFVMVLSSLARRRGFKCLQALDGQNGLHLADYYRPSAIILDIGLPGMDGWQVLDGLKKNERTKDIPVHFLSASEKQDEAKKRGAVGFLAKPASGQQLQEMLAELEEQAQSAVKKLLIVEDHQDQRASMVALISDLQVEIDAVATGAEALEMVTKHNYDCMILDLGLEDMEGMELLERLSDDERLQTLPVIVYTGRELTPQEEERLRRYSDSIIIKGRQSPERLLAETTLFLHQVEEHLGAQSGLASLYRQEDIFVGRKVLVVDDDMRNVFALTSALEEVGVEVLAADNGRKALDMLEQSPDIHVVLMDIMMPEMDGFEAMAKIRAQHRFRRLPIIALTAKAMKDDRHKCIEAGANDYLAKPVEIGRLLSMLRVWLCQ